MSIELTRHVKNVFAVDVSEEITKVEILPRNFRLILSDGCSIPLHDNSIDLAYSNNLMEHLHPDDAFDQLKNIFNVLNSGGKYLCITPNRMSGPHDISKYFDSVATCFHLKEYAFTELCKLFEKIGFSKIEAYTGGKGIYLKVPLLVIKLFETSQRTTDFVPKSNSEYFASQSIIGHNCGRHKIEHKCS